MAQEGSAVPEPEKSSPSLRGQGISEDGLLSILVETPASIYVFVYIFIGKLQLSVTG